MTLERLSTALYVGSWLAVAAGEDSPLHAFATICLALVILWILRQP